MSNRLLITGLILSITLISSIAFYALSTNQKIIESFEAGDGNFKDIATAATELSSYAKRAEGHLVLYLALHRSSDKDKFPQRMKSLQEQIFILDQKVENPDSRIILDTIKANAGEVVSVGMRLIADHDKAMELSGEFEMESHRDTVFGLHERFSTIRKNGVELAKLEINLDHKLKQDVAKEAARLRFYMLIMITLTSVFALFLGYLLIRVINNLNQEVSSRLRSENQIKLQRNKLEDARLKVKTLGGLLPICAECKNIRDDKGYWNQIESYIRDHSEAEFSHSICPSCLKKLYPEYYNDDES